MCLIFKQIFKLLFLLQKKAFIQHSKGDVITPPIGFCGLDAGNLHIKSGYLKKDSIFIVKQVTGFPKNKELGLSTSDGCILVFCANTGVLKTILLDRGYHSGSWI